MTDKDTFFSAKALVNIHGELVDISSPSVMGIINITPDSFYKGSRFNDVKSIIERTNQIVAEGAKFADVGAYSSRPGAEDIDEETEKERLKPALSAIKKEFPNLIVSLDTFRSSVAEWAVGEYGIEIINDISGGSLDDKMYTTVAKLKTPYILMHMRGTPSNMNQMAHYNNITREVMTELSAKLVKLRENGVNDVIIDPGFGFARTIENSYQMLNALEAFHVFGLPLLIGVSRKAMVYKSLDITPDEALNGTTVLHTIALLKGVNILRVHDVKEAVETIKITGNLNN
jgi:dihydropteroate synthase